MGVTNHFGSVKEWDDVRWWWWGGVVFRKMEEFPKWEAVILNLRNCVDSWKGLVLALWSLCYPSFQIAASVADRQWISKASCHAVSGAETIPILGEHVALSLRACLCYSKHIPYCSGDCNEPGCPDLLAPPVFMACPMMTSDNCRDYHSHGNIWWPCYDV